MELADGQVPPYSQMNYFQTGVALLLSGERCEIASTIGGALHRMGPKARPPSAPEGEIEWKPSS